MMAAKLQNTLSREEDEDERAERAREFRTNLNRRRPSRKRYASGNPFVAAGEKYSGKKLRARVGRGWGWGWSVSERGH